MGTMTMSASDRTKWSIVDALEHALTEKAFCKISVADITDYCHIARQTFYNHFLDKYDVIDWIYAQLIKQTTCRIGIDMTWEEATSAKLSVMKSKQKLFSLSTTLIRTRGSNVMNRGKSMITMWLILPG